MTTLPTFFLSHGGGPWPWMDGPFRDACQKLEASLKSLPSLVGAKPTAILMVSAHWEERDFSVMTSHAPPMLYDYYGFPDSTYAIRYAAPGSPELAQRVRRCLEEAGFATGEDPARGYDHGAFVPLAVAYPNADIPVVQLSIRTGYDPDTHIAAGRALRSLRDQDVLIIGSGLSYHNLRQFNASAHRPSKEFDDWLGQTLAISSAPERNGKLAKWAQAPSARLAHPREDHLLPLMVALGAAEQEHAELIYHEDNFLGGIVVSSYRFGDASLRA